MTDRELLELAAKAAGETGQIVQRPYDGGRIYCMERHDGTFWMPQHDDGDALRLAVKMGMMISYMGDRFDLFQRCYLEGLDADLPPSEATRRAIVRAAADIGRAML